MSKQVSILCKAQNGAILPEYKTKGAAGADICAYLAEPIELKHGQFMAVPTGLSFEIPEGYEIQVRPRSGLASKYGVTCLNAPGTIDSDYRGEVKVILINHGPGSFVINNGDRIAQLIISSVIQGTFKSVEILNDTERGEQGFGSTGVK